MTTIHVSKNDPSAFSTLQEAILSIDDRHDEAIRIEVAPGIYEEKLFIRKENIEIVGDDPLTTVFRYGDGAKKPRPDASGEYGTFNTAVIFIAGKDITLRNLTIESTAGPGYLAGQALAVYAAADRLSCYNCRFTGWQDTIFNGDPMTCNMKKLMLPDFFQASEVPIVHKFYRNYFKDCYVCGDVDYIFGPNTAFFDHCEIHSIARVSEGKAYITAASTPAGQDRNSVLYSRIVGSQARSRTPSISVVPGETARRQRLSVVSWGIISVPKAGRTGEKFVQKCCQIILNMGTSVPVRTVPDAALSPDAL